MAGLGIIGGAVLGAAIVLGSRERYFARGAFLIVPIGIAGGALAIVAAEVLKGAYSRSTPWQFAALAFAYAALGLIAFSAVWLRRYFRQKSGMPQNLLSRVTPAQDGRLAVWPQSWQMFRPPQRPEFWDQADEISIAAAGEVHEAAAAYARKMVPLPALESDRIIVSGLGAAAVSFVSLVFAGVDVNHPPGAIIVSAAFGAGMLIRWIICKRLRHKYYIYYNQEYSRLIKQRGDPIILVR